MELSEGAPLRFAGLGLMLANPSFVLSFATDPHAADTPSGITPDFSQVECTASVRAEIAQRLQQVTDLRRTSNSDLAQPTHLNCRIGVLQALPLHSGLGAGTQLACAVAAGLELLAHDRPQAFQPNNPSPANTSTERVWSPWRPVSQLWPAITPRWLVRYAGRGLRSAVGLSGFLHGGLLLDKGYGDVSSLQLADRPLTAHSTRMPEPWRVVLISPTSGQQMHGGRESKLMQQLGNQPNRRCGQMLQLAERMHNAVQTTANFVEFVDALEPYMELGAQLFSDYQQGLYNGAEITAAVAEAREVGLRGVGQSSWGPTVFGFAPDVLQAETMAQQLSRQRPDWQVMVTKPAASGAEVRWLI